MFVLICLKRPFRNLGIGISIGIQIYIFFKIIIPSELNVLYVVVKHFTLVKSQPIDWRPTTLNYKDISQKPFRKFIKSYLAEVMTEKLYDGVWNVDC